MNVFFASLGCDKNLVDSEHMLGLLERDGYRITDDETQAEVIIVNTCCFIGDAKEESIGTILELAEQKEAGRCRALIVTGCLAQRYRSEVLKEMPEVDAVLGTMSYDRITAAIDAALRGERFEVYENTDRLLMPEEKRLLTTGGHYAYLKIAEGCGKHCTYCVIPSVRGGFRSFPMEKLEKEARELAAQGVKELILVAQETTLYGTDLYGRKTLHELVRTLCRIPGLQWIRILYCYPEEIYDELIETIAAEPKVCRYLDLPIQHADDDILRRMGRRTDRASLEALIAKLRERIPDIVLRTTLITGFPGETQAQHETALRFVEEMRFDRLGVFTFSREEGTPADLMEDQVDGETAAARRDELMLLQQKIAFEKAEAAEGRVMDVMVEGFLPDEQVYVCRTEGDAPGVDGYLFLDTERNLMSGDFVRVLVTGASGYDLVGELLEDEGEWEDDTDD